MKGDKWNKQSSYGWLMIMHINGYIYFQNHWWACNTSTDNNIKNPPLEMWDFLLRAMIWIHLSIYSLDIKVQNELIDLVEWTSQWGSLAFGQQHTSKYLLRLSASFRRDFHPYQMNYSPLWERSSLLKIFSCDSIFSLDYSKTAHGWGKWEKKSQKRSES